VTNFAGALVEGGHKFTASSSFTICGVCGYEWPIGCHSQDLPICLTAFDKDFATGPREEPKCDCGCASLGIKPYERGHSSWCQVAPL